MNSCRNTASIYLPFSKYGTEDTSPSLHWCAQCYKMWSLKEKLKKRALKASITSTTTAAKNSAPTLHAVTIGSGGGTTTASLANSQAASAAVAELTAGLDFVFDDSLLRGEGNASKLLTYMFLYSPSCQHR